MKSSSVRYNLHHCAFLLKQNFYSFILIQVFSTYKSVRLTANLSFSWSIHIQSSYQRSYLQQTHILHTCPFTNIYTHVSPQAALSDYHLVTPCQKLLEQSIKSWSNMKMAKVHKDIKFSIYISTVLMMKNQWEKNIK